MFFKIFTKVSLSNIVWNLKTGKKSFPNKMFKHSKISNITQTFLKKTLIKCVVFFRTTIFQCLNTKNCCLESHTKQVFNFQVTLLNDLFINKLKIMGFIDKTKLFFSPRGPPLCPSLFFFFLFFFLSLSFNKITFFSLLF